MSSTCTFEISLCKIGCVHYWFCKKTRYSIFRKNNVFAQKNIEPTKSETNRIAVFTLSLSRLALSYNFDQGRVYQKTRQEKMKRKEWVEMLDSRDIGQWDLLTCLNFLFLGQKTQNPLPGGISVTAAKKAIRERILNLLSIAQHDLPYRDVETEKKGKYETVNRALVAATFNLGERLLFPNTNHVIAIQNGAAMNKSITKCLLKLQEYEAVHPSPPLNLFRNVPVGSICMSATQTPAAHSHSLPSPMVPPHPHQAPDLGSLSTFSAISPPSTLHFPPSPSPAPPFTSPLSFASMDFDLSRITFYKLPLQHGVNTSPTP